MIFRSGTIDAVLEMERQRTGDYGEQDETLADCSRCGADAEYSICGDSLCLDCLTEQIRIAIEEIIEQQNPNDEIGRGAKQVLTNLIEEQEIENFTGDCFTLYHI